MSRLTEIQMYLETCILSHNLTPGDICHVWKHFWLSKLGGSIGNQWVVARDTVQTLLCTGVLHHEE